MRILELKLTEHGDNGVTYFVVKRQMELTDEFYKLRCDQGDALMTMIRDLARTLDTTILKHQENNLPIDK